MIINLPPKKLFLMDGLGAFTSAFFIGIILRDYLNNVGLSSSLLIVLALIAVAFSVYSISCYFFVKNHWRKCLRIIALSNFLYLLFTANLVIKNYDSISTIGLIYFSLELSVLSILIYLELISSSNR